MSTPQKPRGGATLRRILVRYLAPYRGALGALVLLVLFDVAADLALLSQNVLTVPAADLPATRSLLTLVDGEVVYEEPGLLQSKQASSPTATAPGVNKIGL